jgi:glucose-6-phosphate dehydrogenase assembly protein OpcA
MTGAAARPARMQPVAPEAIDDELARLWRDAAADGSVSHAAMSNLVIVSQDEGTDQASDLDDDSDVVKVAQQHPARIIRLHYPRGAHHARAPKTASVCVLAFGATSARYGVEVIELSAPCADESIPSIVRRLARGDVPTTVWWTDDLSDDSPPGPLVSAARQFLYDSACWRDAPAGIRTAAAIATSSRDLDIADLNWRRLIPLRQAIVHALQGEPDARALAPRDVAVRYGPGAAAAAWLLVGWLRCRLKWSGPDSLPHPEQSSQDTDIVGISLGGSGWNVTATMTPQHIEVSTGGARPPFSVPVPPESTADAVVAELRTLGRDSCLRDALIALAEMPA